MTQSILVVLSNPVPGRDEDFNDWYTHIHFHDALSFRGVIGAQRFRLCGQQIQDFPACWDVLTRRFTADEIAHPTSTLLAAGEAARMRMGDRIHHQLAELTG